MMKNINKIFLATFLVSIFLFSCDPNEDLYEKLDKDKAPYNEDIEYTLIDADYDRFSGFIRDYKAFNDSLIAMDYIPDILKVRFVTLRERSTAMVTYNFFLLHPDWWDSGFGRILIDEDYNYIGIDEFFTPEDPAKDYLPFFLLKEYPEAEEDDIKKIVYNFREEGEIFLNIDTYEFDGEEWIWVETVDNIPYAGYELTSEDYDIWGGSIAQYNNFQESDPPENYLPVFLKNKYPYDPIGSERVLKYRYYDGSSTKNIINKFVFDGVVWNKVPYVEERSEQYIFGEFGWAFDPTVRFTLTSSDYQHLVDVDPIGQQEFAYDDFAYYYGASVFYSNFDIRIIGRRLDKLENGEYADPELGEIYENEGRDAAMDEMMRRIVEEGLIELLQHKFPDATPEVEGITVDYYLSFETFADNWVRDYPKAHYRCNAAGDPPQFELITYPYIEND